MFSPLVVNIQPSPYACLRQKLLNFLIGFLPLTSVGLALAVLGGHDTLVYCGTWTPLPPCNGALGCACAQIAWLPYWNALWLVPIGLVLGALLSYYYVTTEKGEK